MQHRNLPFHPPAPQQPSVAYGQQQQQQLAMMRQQQHAMSSRSGSRADGFHLQQQPAAKDFLSLDQIWLRVGRVASRMEEWETAVPSFEAAIRLSPSSVPAHCGLAVALHSQQQYAQAIEVYHRILALASRPKDEGLKGEVWAAIGHCALLLDDLGRAFSAFQAALQVMGSPKDSSIWFAIGLLYDRYGADELAREAFLITLQHEQAGRTSASADASPREKEIYYRLGLIYMNMKRWELSQECFEWAREHPPAGLGPDDIYFYVGVLHSIKGRVDEGRAVFEHILGNTVESNGVPRSSKNTQLRAKHILGWYEALCNGPEGLPRGLEILKAAIDEDPSISFGWYCLGRIYMLARDFVRAYDAYQQAVYRDGTNACFWNSIGILYFDIGQYRDALDAFSRSIHLAPFVADTWWNLGVLYESSHGQIEDALDAYGRAAELDPECTRITQHIARLKKGDVDAKEKEIEAKSDELWPVEYCPMPFFSRPVVLGGANTVLSHRSGSIPSATAAAQASSTSALTPASSIIQATKQHQQLPPQVFHSTAPGGQQPYPQLHPQHQHHQQNPQMIYTHQQQQHIRPPPHQPTPAQMQQLYFNRMQQQHQMQQAQSKFPLPPRRSQ